MGDPTEEVTLHFHPGCFFDTLKKVYLIGPPCLNDWDDEDWESDLSEDELPEISSSENGDGTDTDGSSSEWSCEETVSIETTNHYIRGFLISLKFKKELTPRVETLIKSLPEGCVYELHPEHTWKQLLLKPEYTKDAQELEEKYTKYQEEAFHKLDEYMKGLGIYCVGEDDEEHYFSISRPKEYIAPVEWFTEKTEVYDPHIDLKCHQATPIYKLFERAKLLPIAEEFGITSNKVVLSTLEKVSTDLLSVKVDT